ncbi:MAG: hypothetical protein HKN68_10195 [Saprospiraceae bacterium]|nr:hypothetical protein [Saprospiraceae bacterium]
MKKLIICLLAIQFMACSNEDTGPIEMEEEEEEMEITIDGDYTGTWDDNIYTSFPISAKISESRKDFYSGPFFYSQNGSFVPCCMDTGDNGSISFEVKGDSIINFQYDQDLQFYMGGCPGLYKGSGTINSNGWLLIDFTGDDCDGTHVGGKIVLRK